MCFDFFFASVLVTAQRSRGLVIFSGRGGAKIGIVGRGTDRGLPSEAIPDPFSGFRLDRSQVWLADPSLQGGIRLFLFKVLVTARRSQELVFWQGCPSKENPVRVQSEIAHDLPWQSLGRSPLTRLGAWPIYFKGALPCPLYFQGDSQTYFEVVEYLEVDSELL